MTESDSIDTSDGLAVVAVTISCRTQEATIISRVTDQEDGQSLELKISRTGGSIITLTMTMIGRVSLGRNTLVLTGK